MADIAMIQETELEDMLSDSVFNQLHVHGVMTSYFQTIVTSPGGIGLPTLQAVLTMEQLRKLNLKTALLDIYEKYAGFEKGAEKVPDNVRISQAALFDGLCFAYDSETGKKELYTMNYRVLRKLGIDGVDMSKQVVKKNVAGLVKGYRIDVEYVNSDKTFTFKAVNARLEIDDTKPDTDETKRVFLIPYTVISSFMKLIEMLLDSGKVLMVTQYINEATKIRFVTLNNKVLSSYCDDPSALVGIEPKYFPLRAFMYAPVLGAPSTTSMVTNIDMFDVVGINQPSTKVISSSVEKPQNPMRDIFRQSVIANKIIIAREKSPDTWAKAVRVFPQAELLLPEGVNPEDVSDAAVASYLHSLNEGELKYVENAVKATSKVTKLSNMLFAEPHDVASRDPETLKGILKHNLVRFVVQKKDCTLSSITGTNNTDILMDIYGDGYFRRYESFASRFYAFIEALKGDEDISSEDSLKATSVLRRSLNKYGFHYNAQLVELIKSHLDECYWVAGDFGRFESRAKYILAEDEGVNLKASEAASNNSAKSEDSSVIMVRTFNGYIDPKSKKPTNFYRSIDCSKILSAKIIG